MTKLTYNRKEHQQLRRFNKFLLLSIKIRILLEKNGELQAIHCEKSQIIYDYYFYLFILFSI